MNPIARRARQIGVTLVELMVAIVIGLIVVLVATNVLVIGEAHKRTTTSSNDAGQSGAFTAYALDRALRSAGSGYAQAWDQGVFGCNLTVSRKIGGSATAILPRTSAFPAPFATFLGGAGGVGALRLAPVLIGRGQGTNGTDVIVVMSGNGAAGDVLRPIRSGVAGTDNLRMDNTVGLGATDIGLITQAGTTACLLEQANVTDTTAFAAVGNEVLPLGGTYFIGGSTLTPFTSTGTAFFSVLGNGDDKANNVQYQMFGVDSNRTLVSYDLLRSAATTLVSDPTQPVADSVSEIYAMYGVDTSSPHDNIVDSWQAPSGAWAIDKVMADPKLMRSIVAVRVALVLRSTNYEKNIVNTGRDILFADVPGAAIPAVSYPAGDDRQHFRERVIETTIPLRNMLLLPAS